MGNVFFIVCPTAVGKSELSAGVADACDAEIVNADAFQIYQGLDILTAKPEAAILTRAPHHLLSAVPPNEQMNAAKFRAAAKRVIGEIHSRGKMAIVSGGSGLYIKALSHGLSPLPEADPQLRKELNAATIDELHIRLRELDRETSERIDCKNKRRLVRALEVCLLTARPVSAQRGWIGPAPAPNGIFLFRERAELYQRIDRRVQEMFAHGVVEEVRALGDLGPTAAKTLGLREIQDLIGGKISETQCIALIQQGTRRYAKRQLTWFRRQTSFKPLNLSLHGSSKAIELISQKARLTPGAAE